MTPTTCHATGVFECVGDAPEGDSGSVKLMGYNINILPPGFSATSLLYDNDGFSGEYTVTSGVLRVSQLVFLLLFMEGVLIVTVWVIKVR